MGLPQKDPFFWTKQTVVSLSHRRKHGISDDAKQRRYLGSPHYSLFKKSKVNFLFVRVTTQESIQVSAESLLSGPGTLVLGLLSSWTWNFESWFLGLWPFCNLVTVRRSTPLHYSG